MSLEDARRALIERQGSGARYDAPGAPAADLVMARRWSAQLARLLNDTPDAILFRNRGAEPSLARQIAEVSLQARRMGELIAAVRADAPLPGLLPVAGEIDHAAHLPARALRHLFDHTRVHLNVEWREMSDADWTRVVTCGDGTRLAAADLPRRRSEALQAASSEFSRVASRAI